MPVLVVPVLEPEVVVPGALVPEAVVVADPEVVEVPPVPTVVVVDV